MHTHMHFYRLSIAWKEKEEETDPHFEWGKEGVEAPGIFLLLDSSFLGSLLPSPCYLALKLLSSEDKMEEVCQQLSLATFA